MDKADSTLSRGVVAPSQLPWSAEAQELLRICVSSQPVLIQISVAKTLRDATDRAAQAQSVQEVSAELVLETARSLGMEPPLKSAESELSSASAPSAQLVDSDQSRSALAASVKGVTA